MALWGELCPTVHGPGVGLGLGFHPPVLPLCETTEHAVLVHILPYFRII